MGYHLPLVIPLYLKFALYLGIINTYYDMALIRFSNLVNDIRGAAGGNVFARNRSGAYVRNRTTPLNPQSTGQQIARAAFGGLSQAWRTLTEAQRQAWADAAPEYPYLNKLGESRVYSGEQLYMKLNRNLQAAGQSLINEPLAPMGVDSVNGLTMDVDVNGLAVNLTGTLESVDSASTIVIQASAPLSAGKSTVPRSAFKNIATATEAEIVVETDYSTEYQAVFGSFAGQEGAKVFFRVYSVNNATGQASAPFIASTVIVDTTV